MLGEPPARWHPVVGMGRYLGALGPRIAPAWGAPAGTVRPFVLGALAWMAGALLVVAIAFALMRLVSGGPVWLQVLVTGLLLKPLLAWRMLRQEVVAVEAALGESLVAGRERLGWLVSRDVAALDEAQVRESAIESLAENLNDSVVAPLFWFAIAGLPGAALYRFANTADAMWGYRGERQGRDWTWAGKWAARADDVLSWLPARLTGVLLGFLGAFRGWRALPAQARRTPSPNSGWPMAAMALALNVRLGKPGVYALNAEGRSPEATDTARALQLAGGVVQALAGGAVLWAAFAWGTPHDARTVDFPRRPRRAGRADLGLLHQRQRLRALSSAQAKVLRADARHYPDPAYTALRASLAAFHAVAVERIVIAGSASEFIGRITAWAAREGGRRVWLPALAYGDYARAASAWRLERTPDPAQADLAWLCEPASPLGQAEPRARAVAASGAATVVLDRAYEPLRLSGQGSLDPEVLDRVWQLWTPNKALGLTGVRGSYAIAPVGGESRARALDRLAPSWPLGAHAVALLEAWTSPDAQAWVAQTRPTLARWTGDLRALLAGLGWAVQASDAPYFCATPPQALDAPALRSQGIKLRDASSFGLPGQWRLSAQPPEAQAALRAALAAQEERVA